MKKVCIVYYQERIGLKMKKVKVPRTSIFLWNLLGSLSSAGISIILLFLVTRMLSAQDGDVYSYGYAISNLFVIISVFQVRDFQATDISEKYSFADYFYTRILTLLIYFLSSFLYLWLNHQPLNQNLVTIGILLFRSSESLSDVYQGFFQQHERLDIAGKSLFFRNALSTLIFAVILSVTSNLLVSIISQTLFSYLFVWFYDFYQYRSLGLKSDFKIHFTPVRNILIECLPLFINAFLLVSIYNQPKYSLNYMYQVGLVASGVQRDFSIIFTPIFTLNLMIVFFRPIITSLAIYLKENRIADFIRTKRRFFLMIGLLSLLIFLIGALVGIPVLNIVYGLHLEEYQVSFIILLLGGVASTFATVIDNILTIYRKQKYIVLAFVIAYVTSLLISDGLVRTYGIQGASVSFLISMLVWYLSSSVIYFIVSPYSIFRKKKL